VTNAQLKITPSRLNEGGEHRQWRLASPGLVHADDALAHPRPRREGSLGKAGFRTRSAKDRACR